MTYISTHHHIECNVYECGARFVGDGSTGRPEDIRKAAAEHGWTSSHSMANAMADIGPTDICPADHDA